MNIQSFQPKVRIELDSCEPHGESTKKLAKAPAHRQRRREARPREIMESALVAFAQKGFGGATVEEIAHGAGITKGTLYLYFANKEEIFKSLILESISLRISHFAQEVQEFEGSSADLIRVIVRDLGFYLRSSDRAALPKLILGETSNFPELARFYKDEVADRGLAVVETIIRRGVRSGEFRDIDSKHAARLVIVPVIFAAIWRHSLGTLDGEPYDYEGLIETHLDFSLRALTAVKKP